MVVSDRRLSTRTLGAETDFSLTVLWMHGLGATNTDFDPLIPWLGLEGVRFVFPQAPERPVSINYGMSDAGLV